VILTFDNGQSSTKVALVNDDYSLAESDDIIVNKREIQDFVIETSKEYEHEQIAIATTNFIRSDGKRAYSSADDHLNISVIAKAIQKKVSIYNDAEAAAYALNLPQKSHIIQEGSIENPTSKNLVYLGTGFQSVPLYFEEGYYKPTYANLIYATLPASVERIVDRNFLKNLAQIVGVDVSSLRHTDLLSARGVSNIHTVLTSDKVEVADLTKNNSEFTSTFDLYYKFIGNYLREFSDTTCFDQALYIAGSYAAALGPFIDKEKILEGFSDGRAIRLKTPITWLEEKYGGNRGAAFAAKKHFKTTAGIF
jgi:glucokinase